MKYDHFNTNPEVCRNRSIGKGRNLAPWVVAQQERGSGKQANVYRKNERGIVGRIKRLVAR